MTIPQKVNCPTCNKLIDWSNKYPHKPFCSDRCRLIDLGEWIDGNRRIPSDETLNTSSSEEE